MKKKPTQKDKVLDYMIKYGSITQRDALIDLSVMRLASRIAELKKDGYNIESEREKGVNKNGDTVFYARYRVEEE